MLTEAKHAVILGREEGGQLRKDRRGDKDKRGERRGRGWGRREGGVRKEAGHRGMTEGWALPPQPQKRKGAGAEDQRPLRPKALARLAVSGPLASSLVHFDEQILDILDLPLHRLSPLPQLPVPCLQPLALALQGLALCALPLPVPQSRRLVLVPLLLLAVPAGGGRIGVGGRARGWRWRRGLLG